MDCRQPANISRPPPEDECEDARSDDALSSVRSRRFCATDIIFAAWIYSHGEREHLNCWDYFALSVRIHRNNLQSLP